MVRRRALIIGGGFTGLTAAWHLRRQGHEVTVLEASPHPGGWLRELHWPHLDGRPGTCPLGAQTLRFPRRSALARLVAALGLPLDQASPSGPRWYLGHEGLKPWPPPLGLKGVLRLCLEPLIPGTTPSGTLQDLAVRRFGTAYASLVFPSLVGSLLAAHPTQVDALALPDLVKADAFGGIALQTLRNGWPRRWVPKSGMNGLVEVLSSSGFTPHSPVTTLHKVEDRWRVEGPWGETSAQLLVLALPSSEAARLLQSVAPRAARLLSEIQATRLWVHHSRHHAPWPGLGLKVDPGVGSSLLGIQGRRQGGVLQLATYATSPDEVTLPLPGLPPPTQVRRTEAALPLIPPDHSLRRMAILASLPPGLEVLGSWRWGPGLANLAEGLEAWVQAGFSGQAWRG